MTTHPFHGSLLLAFAIAIGSCSDSSEPRCQIECAAPPPGCRFDPVEGECSCGTLVCEDAGPPPMDSATPPDACVACNAPEGCHYESGSCTSCGELVCEDAGCESVCPPVGPFCHYASLPTCDPTSCSDVICDDASDGGVCAIECPAPPPGCTYATSPSCDPPGCGELRCPDGGGGSCVIDCPPAPRGCRWTIECFPARCADLVCGSGDGGMFFDATIPGP